MFQFFLPISHMNCVLFVLNREESDACLWKDVQRIHVSGSNDAENKSDVVGNLKDEKCRFCVLLQITAPFSFVPWFPQKIRLKSFVWEHDAIRGHPMSWKTQQ